MDSIKCQALLLAIQHGSLTAAGKELGYTQSGITRMIQSLEEEIGFPLLVRNNQGVQPSANGRQMMPVFQEVVRASQKPSTSALPFKASWPASSTSAATTALPPPGCRKSSVSFKNSIPTYRSILWKVPIKNWPNGSMKRLSTAACRQSSETT